MHDVNHSMYCMECGCCDVPLHMHFRWGSPRRRIQLLGIAHHVVGSPFQVFRQTALLRGRDYEAGQTVALIHFLCIYWNKLVLIYVLY